MNAMTAKYFVDTNIVLYTIGKDPRKTSIARGLVADYPVLSAQVVNESINVCLKKLAFDKAKAYAFAESIMRRTQVVAIDEITIRKSALLAMRYQLSNWDALIVAAALLSDCEILYLEDMQDGQKFEGKLMVKNPFL